MKLLFTMSAQGAVLIMFLLLAGRLTKRWVSPRARYALWLLPALRLMLPFTFESELSLMRLLPDKGGAALGGAQALPVHAQAPIVTAGALAGEAAAASSPARPYEMPAIAPQTAGISAAGELSAGDIALIVWLCGAALAFAYMIYVNARFYILARRNSERLDISCALPVYLMKGLGSPCLCGYFRPRILINEAALKDESTLTFVLKHELCHYRAGDQWTALTRNICIAMHWFNPLVWLAAFRSRADCELACDARATQLLDERKRRAYGMALLDIIDRRVA